MKKLLLILSLISLPLTSAVNSLNISVRVMDGDDPKSVSEEKASTKTNTNIEPNYKYDFFISYFGTSYKMMQAMSYKKNSETEYEKNIIMAIGGESRYYRNTDTIVNQIIQLSEKSIKNNNKEGLAMCVGGNNEDYSDEVFGVTINDIEYIRKLSKLQNEGTDKESECIIPKEVNHEFDNLTGEKTVEVVYDVIDLETGSIKKENQKKEVYFSGIKYMNMSAIYTTVTRLNALNESYKKMYETPSANNEK